MSERGNMKREIGVAVIGLGWMGQVHSRGYRRLFDHYPECPLKPRLVIAADAVEEADLAALIRSFQAAGLERG